MGWSFIDSLGRIKLHQPPSCEDGHAVPRLRASA